MALMIGFLLDHHKKRDQRPIDVHPRWSLATCDVQLSRPQGLEEWEPVATILLIYTIISIITVRSIGAFEMPHLFR